MINKLTKIKLKNLFNNNYLIIILGIFIILLDQVTKFFARKYLQKTVKINKFFSLDLSFNRGVSWGIFYTNNQFYFYLINLLILFILLIFGYYIFSKIKSGKNIFFDSIVFFGGVSNLIDRFVYEGVVDFLLINYKSYYFPNFNIADIFITTGIFFILLKTIFYEDY